jgi:CDP-diacylglycerol---glycerol-3-phosphate 3-phosphatidyltransferase
MSSGTGKTPSGCECPAIDHHGIAEAQRLCYPTALLIGIRSNFEGLQTVERHLHIMPGSLRTSALAAAYYGLMERFLLPRLPSWGMTPNRLTWTGMLISIAVPLGFWAHPFLGFGLILVSGAADSLDGLMARHQKRSSTWGAFLDSSLDRISDFFYLLGFWVPLSRLGEPAWATLALFICLLLTLLISYTKSRAEALGCRCPVGLMERGVRVVYLILWALVLGLLPAHEKITLWTGLALYAILCMVTVVHRIRYIRGQIEDPVGGSDCGNRADPGR